MALLVPVAMAGARLAGPGLARWLADAWLPPASRAALAPAPRDVTPIRAPQLVGALQRLRRGEGGVVTPTVPNLKDRELELLRRRVPGGVARPGRDGTTSVTYPRLSLEDAQRVLEAVQAVALDQYQTGEALPVSRALHSGRIRYTRHDPFEEWRTPRDLWHYGEGDCDDLAPAVGAELELSGVPARAILLRSGPGQLHAVTHRLDNGHVIDPSITGGMLG